MNIMQRKYTRPSLGLVIGLLSLNTLSCCTHARQEWPMGTGLSVANTMIQSPSNFKVADCSLLNPTSSSSRLENLNDLTYSVTKAIESFSEYRASQELTVSTCKEKRKAQVKKPHTHSLEAFGINPSALRLADIKKAISEGMDPNAVDQNGNSILILLVRRNKQNPENVLICHYLTQTVWRTPLNLELGDKDGMTALNLASQYRKNKVADCFIDAGADINTKNIVMEGHVVTPLIYAIVYNDLEQANDLMSKGAKLDINEKVGGKTVGEWLSHNGWTITQSKSGIVKFKTKQNKKNKLSNRGAPRA